MNNILEYAKNNLKTFKEMKFNEIDSLILSWISYYHIHKNITKQKTFSSIFLKDLYNAKYFEPMLFDVFDIKNSKLLITYLAANPRFMNIEIYYYVEQMSKSVEKQFSAMTFRLDKNIYYIAYRGTDHSFIGWKEDFNMAYKKSVPSQLEAVKYANKIFENIKGKFYIGGHSKGGNLAVYASSKIDKKYQNKIIQIHNFDGPGLNNELINTESHKNIKNKILKIVPQSSIIGMCFENTTDYQIIKSDGIGVLQHNPFTWNIKNNKFVNKNTTTKDSESFKKGINNLISNMSEKDIKDFINILYNIINNTNENTFDNLSKNFFKNIPVIFSGFNNLNSEQKKLLFKVAENFIKGSL